jgi:hypothetical protein
LTVGAQTVAVNPYPSYVVNIQEQIDTYENYNDYDGGGSFYSPTVIQTLISTNYGINITTDSYRGDVTLVFCNNIVEYNKVVQGATVTRGGGTAGAAVGQPDGWRTLNTGYAGFGTAIASLTSKVKEDIWIRLAVDNPAGLYGGYYGPVALSVDLVTMIVMGVR